MADTVGSFGVSELADVGVSALGISSGGTSNIFPLVLAPSGGVLTAAGAFLSLRRIAPDTVGVTITGYAPTIAISESWEMRPATGALQITGAVPAIHR